MTVPPAARDWHPLSVEDAIARLETHATQGLSEAEAERRLRLHGENRLPAPPPRPAWKRFATQLVQPLVLVLIVSGIVTVAFGEWVDAGVILGVVIVNALIGFVQEGKAENALAALARTLASEATVVRGGHRRRLAAHHLVPGDLVVLAAGDRVPADLRLADAAGLRAMEAALTGESVAVDKHVSALPADTQLPDRGNMAYAGTLVVGGQGVGVVTATGRATETGRISGLMSAIPDLQTPLTRKMAEFSNRLLVAIGALAILTFVVGLARGEPAFDMFMAAVALAIGAIPEGLPAAVTITLAIGVSRMARRRVIIRRLPAVEALGSTTVICSDKTGTLTENEMTVRELWVGGEIWRVGGSGYAPDGVIGEAASPARIEGGLRELLVAGALCNDAGLVHREGRWEIAGDPTEAALLVLAKKGGLDASTLQALLPRVAVLPFDAACQYMASLHAQEARRIIFMKGAVERVLAVCGSALDVAGSSRPLDAPLVLQHAERLAAAGYRVLAVARGEAATLAEGANLSPAAIASAGLSLVGLVAMIDPPRPRAVAAVRACRAAGVAVKMITGDHAVTALAIARQLGIVRPSENERTLAGDALAALDDAALSDAVREVSVFARVAPEQKLRLVEALRRNGEVVAMTGDGVNDAPALKAADIGVAMGLGGTDVAREAAAMVLTDDNFASIEAAVEEGRAVYANLVKFITWTLPTNIGEGLVIVVAIIAGATLPITPLQILWINMTTAVLLGLMLAFEPVERGLMALPPRPPQAPILDAALVGRICLVSVLLLFAAYGLFLNELSQGHALAEARTVAVNVFVLVETFYLFNCRSLTRSFVAVGVFSNPWVWVGSGLMLGLQLMLTYLPAMNRLFGTAPIALDAWGWIIAAGAGAALVVAFEKRWRRTAVA